MFKCRNCKSVDKFELMFSKDYDKEKTYTQAYNEKNQIEITVGDYTFIPDLNFMNEHAVCRYCGQIYIWEKEEKNEKKQKK